MTEIVLATRNPGKLEELRALLAGDSWRLRTLADFPGMPDVAEDGAYRENAVQKAVTAARWTGRLAVADDSGLEVAALGGLPGARSARLAGPTAGDAENRARLLELLRDTPVSSGNGRRTARFICMLAAALPDGRVEVVEGSCEGVILEAERGSQGFGYDPIFLVPTYGQTFAELPAEVKNRLSHRAQAATRMREVLAGLIRSCGA